MLNAESEILPPGGCLVGLLKEADRVIFGAVLTKEAHDICGHVDCCVRAVITMPALRVGHVESIFDIPNGGLPAC